MSNEGDSSVSIVDADPRHSQFMTELKRIKVGSGPRSVACNPDGEDVFVMNYAANTISILNQSTGNVRKLLRSDAARVNTRTPHPSCNKARATAAPTKPVAPVTKTFLFFQKDILFSPHLPIRFR